jgi:hypothetical protein
MSSTVDYFKFNLIASAFALTSLIIIHSIINYQFFWRLKTSSFKLEEAKFDIDLISKIIAKYNSTIPILSFVQVEKNSDCPDGYKQRSLYNWEGTEEGIHLSQQTFSDSCIIERCFNSEISPPVIANYSLDNATCYLKKNTTNLCCKYRIFTAFSSKCVTSYLGKQCICPETYTANNFVKNKSKELENREYFIIQGIPNTTFSHIYGKKLCYREIPTRLFVEKGNCNVTMFGNENSSVTYCWEYGCVNDNTCPQFNISNGLKIQRPIYDVFFNYGGRKCSLLEGKETYDYKINERNFYLSKDEIKLSKVCDKLPNSSYSSNDQFIIYSNKSYLYYSETDLLSQIKDKIDVISDQSHRMIPFLNDSLYIYAETDLHWNFTDKRCQSQILASLLEFQTKSKEIISVSDDYDVVNYINFVIIAISVIIAIWVFSNIFRNIKSQEGEIFRHKAVNFFFLISVIQFVINVIKLAILYHNFKTNTLEQTYIEVISNNCFSEEGRILFSLRKIYEGIDYFTLNYNRNLISVVVENGVAIVLFFLTFIPFISFKEIFWL